MYFYMLVIFVAVTFFSPLVCLIAFSLKAKGSQIYYSCDFCHWYHT